MNAISESSHQMLNSTMRAINLGREKIRNFTYSAQKWLHDNLGINDSRFEKLLNKSIPKIDSENIKANSDKLKEFLENLKQRIEEQEANKAKLGYQEENSKDENDEEKHAL